MSEGDVRTARRAAATERPLVVALDDPVAVDSSLTGGKAAALARGKTSGLASLPGVVLTTAFSDAVDGGAELRTHDAVRQAFDQAGGDQRALVARSSSVVEDMEASSMAGQFESVIGISGFEAFADAVKAVLDSRERAGAADHPIAVLVQPLIEPAYGGVMFGIDPVTGRTDRRVVSAVTGGPERLVSGEVDGSRYVLDPSTAKVLDFRPQRRPEAGAGRPAAARRSVRPRSPRSTAVRRTSNGRSTPTGSCGCCSRDPSRRRSAAFRAARSTARDRSPRPSPIRSPNWRAICGSHRFEKRWAKQWSWPAPPRRRTSRPAMSSSASTGMWPSTCAWPGS